MGLFGSLIVLETLYSFVNNNYSKINAHIVVNIKKNYSSKLIYTTTVVLQDGSQMYWVTADCSRALTILIVLAIKLVHCLGPVPHVYFQQLQ